MFLHDNSSLLQPGSYFIYLILSTISISLQQYLITTAITEFWEQGDITTMKSDGARRQRQS